MFIPVDTSNSTYYYVGLRYSPAFQQFAFDFVQDKRTKWRDETDFNRNFSVTPEMMDRFVRSAEENHDVPFDEKAFRKSYDLISRALKAEIARQLFLEQGYFTVTTQYDNEVQRAVRYLRTGK